MYAWDSTPDFLEKTFLSDLIQVENGFNVVHIISSTSIGRTWVSFYRGFFSRVCLCLSFSDDACAAKADE